MAVIYRRGLGVTPDAAESAKWLIQSANLGYPRAMLQLGEAYWKGDGVKPNLITAYTWVWMAYKSQATGAQQDEAAFRNLMDARDVEKAKKNAESSPARHHLVLLQKTH
jgi:TPR repeat protein